MTNIEAFCHGLTVSAGKRRATVVIYFYFTKNFHVVPHNILLCKLEREQAERAGAVQLGEEIHPTM